mgnify:CR=1 FL=1
MDRDRDIQTGDRNRTRDRIWTGTGTYRQKEIDRMDVDLCTYFVSIMIT